MTTIKLLTYFLLFFFTLFLTQLADFQKQYMTLNIHIGATKSSIIISTKNWSCFPLLQTHAKYNDLITGTKNKRIDAIIIKIIKPSAIRNDFVSTLTLEFH